MLCAAKSIGVFLTVKLTVGALAMARCLRCGADSSWLEGTVKPEPDGEWIRIPDDENTRRVIEEARDAIDYGDFDPPHDAKVRAIRALLALLEVKP